MVWTYIYAYGSEWVNSVYGYNNFHVMKSWLIKIWVHVIKNKLPWSFEACLGVPRTSHSPSTLSYRQDESKIHTCTNLFRCTDHDVL